MSLFYLFDTMIRSLAQLTPSRRQFRMAAALMVLVVSQFVHAAVYRVDGVNGNDSNNGGPFWSDALLTIEEAITRAQFPGDEIWVKAGTYTPAGADPVDANDDLDFVSPYGGDDGDRMRTYFLKKNVALYGGFAGTETSRAQADPATNITMETGDSGPVEKVRNGAMIPDHVRKEATRCWDDRSAGRKTFSLRGRWAS